MRGFVDVFADECSLPVTVVQTTGIDRATALNAAGCRYHVVTQGFQDGEVIEETRLVGSIREALATHGPSAERDWAKVMELACQMDFDAIVSNTTEAGLALDASDRKQEEIPHSFPAKLTAVLQARYDSGLHDRPWILPCELVENNADVLKGLVIQQARIWSLEDSLIGWLEKGPRWTNNLVDRIVPGAPKAPHPLLETDPLVLSAEPFAFWGVETDEADEFPFAEHPAVTLTADISPYALRKVRILNGAHSALVCKAPEFGVKTVREAVEHPKLGAWLESLLSEEIVPTLEGRCEDPAGFAKATLDRFRNPFLEHRLESIALNHEAKINTRLVPTAEDYARRFGKEPRLLSSILS